MHPLAVAKTKCLRGTMSYNGYRAQVVSMMQGKLGYVRSLTSITVEGSMKIVISPLTNTSMSIVSIPRHIAHAIKVPSVVDGVIQSGHIKSGDRAILIRQPCLWSGGTVPCIVEVLAPHDNGGNAWDINCSMRLSISKCIPYRADYDGNEMTLFPVKRHESIAECDSTLWDNDRYSPYDIESYAQIVPMGAPIVGTIANTMALATTLCWSDRCNGVRIVDAHKKWGISVHSFVTMTKRHELPIKFANQAMDSMAIATIKLESQRNIGAESRRAKSGTERIFMSRRRILDCQSGCTSTLVSNKYTGAPIIEHGYFGNPTMRAVSKICGASMQITLKVKSSDTVSLGSPTLSMLSGCEKWLVIMKSGAVCRLDKHHNVSYTYFDACFSLFDISRAPRAEQHRLIASFISIVSLESRCRFNRAEYECLTMLLLFICRCCPDTGTGICMGIQRDHREFSTLQVWNSSYVSEKYLHIERVDKGITTLIEYMFLPPSDVTPSISH
jgi:hypothetical protein